MTTMMLGDDERVTAIIMMAVMPTMVIVMLMMAEGPCSGAPQAGAPLGLFSAYPSLAATPAPCQSSPACMVKAR